MKHKLNVRLKNKQIRLFKEYTKKLKKGDPEVLKLMER